MAGPLRFDPGRKTDLRFCLISFFRWSDRQILSSSPPDEITLNRGDGKTLRTLTIRKRDQEKGPARFSSARYPSRVNRAIKLLRLTDGATVVISEITIRVRCHCVQEFKGGEQTGGVLNADC